MSAVIVQTGNGARLQPGCKGQTHASKGEPRAALAGAAGSPVAAEEAAAAGRLPPRGLAGHGRDTVVLHPHVLRDGLQRQGGWVEGEGRDERQRY